MPTVRVFQQLKRVHHRHVDRSSVAFQVGVCKEFFGLLPKPQYCSLLQIVVLRRSLRAFLVGPKTRKSHGDKSCLYAGCLSAFHRTTFSLPWAVWATWGRALCSSIMPWLSVPGRLFLVLISRFETIRSNGLHWFSHYVVLKSRSRVSRCQRTQSASL
jgi:hypothetical protein